MTVQITPEPETGLLSVVVLNDDGSLYGSRILDGDEAKRLGLRMIAEADAAEACGRTTCVSDVWRELFAEDSER